jgi:ribosomal protein S18 acetylase RimI-like enzyme
VADGVIGLRPDVTLRPTQPADRAFLRSLYASTRAGELALVQWPDDQKDAFIEQQFMAQDSYYRQIYPDGRFMVVEVEGRAVGRWYVADLPGELRLVEVTVAPEERRRGIGTALLEALCAEADRRGLPVSLHVEQWNQSLRWYERLGFRMVEERGLYYLMTRPPSGR